VLKDEDLHDISASFEERSFRNKEYVFMEGDPSDFLYLVAKGRVKMLKHSEKGKDVILEIKSPGELFCCSAVLDERPFPESAQAMDDGSVIKIHREKLCKIMERYPDLKVEIARYAGEKLKEAHEMLKNIATEKVEGRIASILLKLSETGGYSDSAYEKINISLTRQEIADMVGTTVESCIRTISKFQKEGMVKSESHNLLVNRSSLRNFLESL
jgi:CRP/FNR family transcriptional regulator